MSSPPSRINRPGARPPRTQTVTASRTLSDRSMTADDETPQADSDEIPDKGASAEDGSSEDEGDPQARSAVTPGGDPPLTESAQDGGPDIAASKGEQSPVPSADAAVDAQLRSITDRVNQGAVEFADVVRLTHWKDIETEDGRHSLGIRYADEAREKFKREHGGEQTRLAVTRRGRLSHTGLRLQVATVARSHRLRPL